LKEGIMEILLQERGPLTIAGLVGEIDGKTAATVQEQLSPIIGEGRSMVVDMSQVTYMSSAGLRLLLTLYRQAAANKGRLVLVGLSEEIQETMDATGFLAYFTVASDVDAGMLALAAG
jgi:anti-sigma B factor antagonist